MARKVRILIRDIGTVPGEGARKSRRSCALIRHMSAENQLWGAPLIHGEPLKLGFSVAQSTSPRRWLSDAGRPVRDGGPFCVITHRTWARVLEECPLIAKADSASLETPKIPMEAWPSRCTAFPKLIWPPSSTVSSKSASIRRSGVRGRARRAHLLRQIAELGRRPQLQQWFQEIDRPIDPVLASRRR